MPEEVRLFHVIGLFAVFLVCYIPRPKANLSTTLSSGVYVGDHISCRMDGRSVSSNQIDMNV